MKRNKSKNPLAILSALLITISLILAGYSKADAQTPPVIPNKPVSLMTGTTGNTQTPPNTNATANSQSAVKLLYRKEQMGDNPFRIENLAFLVRDANNSIGNRQGNWKIYMYHTDEAVLINVGNAVDDTTRGKLVFDDLVTRNENVGEWKIFQFNQNGNFFDYNPDSNLVIIIWRTNLIGTDDQTYTYFATAAFTGGFGGSASSSSIGPLSRHLTPDNISGSSFAWPGVPNGGYPALICNATSKERSAMGALDVREESAIYCYTDPNITTFAPESPATLEASRLTVPTARGLNEWIYTPRELGTNPRRITHISLKANSSAQGGTSINPPSTMAGGNSSTTFHIIQTFMKLDSTKETFSADDYPVGGVGTVRDNYNTDYTLVHTGTWPRFYDTSATLGLPFVKWITIELDTPFDYDGKSNLMLAVVALDKDWTISGLNETVNVNLFATNNFAQYTGLANCARNTDPSATAAGPGLTGTPATSNDSTWGAGADHRREKPVIKFTYTPTTDPVKLTMKVVLVGNEVGNIGANTSVPPAGDSPTGTKMLYRRELLGGKPFTIENIAFWVLQLPSSPLTDGFIGNYQIYMSHTTDNVLDAGNIANDRANYTLVFEGPVYVNEAIGEWKIFDFNRNGDIFNYNGNDNLAVILWRTSDASIIAQQHIAYSLAAFNGGNSGFTTGQLRRTAAAGATTWATNQTHLPSTIFNKTIKDIEVLDEEETALWAIMHPTASISTGGALWGDVMTPRFFRSEGGAFEMIYTPAELGTTPRKLTSLTLPLKTRTNAGDSSHTILSTYMKLSNETTFDIIRAINSSNLVGTPRSLDDYDNDTSNYVEVHRGRWPIINTNPYVNMLTIQFDTSFIYDGESNLHLLVTSRGLAAGVTGAYPEHGLFVYGSNATESRESDSLNRWHTLQRTTPFTNLKFMAKFTYDPTYVPPGKYYNLVVEATNGGLVEGSATEVLGGTQRTIRAIPSNYDTTTACFAFTGWYTTASGGVLISTDNPLIVQVESDTTLYARFTVPQYPVTLTVGNDSTGGKVYGAGTIGCNSTRNILAVADSCYKFERWIVNGSRNIYTPFATLRVFGDMDIVAIFTQVEDTEGFTNTPNFSQNIQVLAGNGSATNANVSYTGVLPTATTDPSPITNIPCNGTITLSTTPPSNIDPLCGMFVGWFYLDWVVVGGNIVNPVRGVGRTATALSTEQTYVHTLVSSQPIVAVWGSRVGAHTNLGTGYVTDTNKGTIHTSWGGRLDGDFASVMSGSCGVEEMVFVRKKDGWRAAWTINGSAATDPINSGIFRSLSDNGDTLRFITVDTVRISVIWETTTFTIDTSRGVIDWANQPLTGAAITVSGGELTGLQAGATRTFTSSLPANLRSCYEWVGWFTAVRSQYGSAIVRGDSLSASPSFTMTVTDNVNICAVYRVLQKRVTYNVVGKGNIVNRFNGCCFEGDNQYADNLMASNGWENVPCQGQTQFNRQIARAYSTATDTCSFFLRWEMNGEFFSNNDTLPQIPILDDVTFTAVFGTKVLASLSVSGGTGGSVEITGGNDTIFCGESNTRTIKAIPDNCYKFVSWSDGNTNAERSITVTANTTLTATFASETFTLTANSNNTAFGSVTVTGTTTGICTNDATRTLTAVPATNCYRFVRWSDSDTNISRTITVTRDTTITATFELRQYNVTINADPVAGGTVSPGGVSRTDCGDTVPVTATANAGFRFRNWTNQAGTVVISSTPQLDVVVASDTTLVAHFVSDTVTLYNVTATATPTGYGTVTGTGPYELNETATLRAVPASADYRFYYWNNDPTNTNPVLSIVVTKDTAVVAHFRSTATNMASVTLGVNPAGRGTVEGEKEYELNATATLKATATDECYKFERWSDGNTNAERTLVVTKDTHLIAEFALIQYNLNVNVGTGGGGTVSPSGTTTRDCGATVALTATPNTNYKFVNWTSGTSTTIVSTERELSVTMSRDTTLVAHFEEDPGNIAEVIKSGAINIMPNPTSDDFVVSFDVLESSNNMQIFLTDLTGREVLHIYDDFVESGLFTKSVKTNNLARGVYFLHVRLNGNVATERITLE